MRHNAARSFLPAHKTRLLFLIILIEGYAVLATELLAIRQLIPFVGSGTEVVSILISGVLLPLALGYHVGATAYRRHFSMAKIAGRRTSSIRALLFRNVLLALAILTPGLSYLFLEYFFSWLDILGITHRLLQTAVYAVLFLAGPVFLLGQTVPLISHYLSKQRLNEITGRMLFFSTAGSFLGSVFSTVVLMSTIGVHNTVIVTLGLLTILGMQLSKKKHGACLFVILFLGGLTLNNDSLIRSTGIVSDNAYNTVRVIPDAQDDLLLLNINRSNSSAYNSKEPERRFKYLRYIDKNFIAPIAASGGKPHDILVLGAGGFTLGLNDSVNHYTYVDIDQELRKVAEQDFLQQKLLPNKQFVVSSARAYVHRDDRKYDLIILDVYTNRISVPMECTTREFLQEVKSLLKDNGIVIANIIEGLDFNERFSIRYDNTFSSVFPMHTRQVLDDLNPWTSLPHLGQVLYIYYDRAIARDRTIYTDDKNTHSFDVP